ncbi:MAG: DUF1697 domain-containing protein [Acidimicrobiia bacterium]
MARYVAFLRGINVGGHNVKSDALRGRVEALGFTAVATFLASGNVVFVAGGMEPAMIEERIAEGLHAALGYAVPTFVRRDDEVARVAAEQPFGPAEPAEGSTLHIGFVGARPGAKERRAVLDLSTAEDRLAVEGRELYWLRRGPLMESSISGPALERALGMSMTLRTANTVRRLAAKYPPARG